MLHLWRDVDMITGNIN